MLFLMLLNIAYYHFFKEREFLILHLSKKFIIETSVNVKLVYNYVKKHNTRFEILIHLIIKNPINKHRFLYYYDYEFIYKLML